MTELFRKLKNAKDEELDESYIWDNPYFEIHLLLLQSLLPRRFQLLNEFIPSLLDSEQRPLSLSSHIENNPDLVDELSSLVERTNSTNLLRALHEFTIWSYFDSQADLCVGSLAVDQYVVEETDFVELVPFSSKSSTRSEVIEVYPGEEIWYLDFIPFYNLYDENVTTKISYLVQFLGALDLLHLIDHLKTMEYPPKLISGTTNLRLALFLSRFLGFMVQETVINRNDVESDQVIETSFDPTQSLEILIKLIRNHTKNQTSTKSKKTDGEEIQAEPDEVKVTVSILTKKLLAKKPILEAIVPALTDKIAKTFSVSHDKAEAFARKQALEAIIREIIEKQESD
jgi:hypothetical protein